jgi:16S rRNA (guanine1516-N2)-methyltransferase
MNYYKVDPEEPSLDGRIPLCPITAVGFDGDESYERAKQLAEKLHLVVDNHLLPRLSVTSDKLVLLYKNFSPLFVDLSSIRWQKRHDAGKKQGLVRACQPSFGVRIVDATAGWGRDAAILASFGAEVLMLERQPVMAALLSDGINRMARSSSMSLSLLEQDAMNYFSTLAAEDCPDVIYIDPMHPMRQKSALVKREMQALQQMIGEDKDVIDLIQLALIRARQRVVVKWPQCRSPVLPPHASIHGKTVRFDLYRPHSP